MPLGRAARARGRRRGGIGPEMSSSDQKDERRVRMSFLTIGLLVLAAVSTAYWLVASWCTAGFRRRPPRRGSTFAPHVTVLKPVRGAGGHLYERLRSFCEQDYADYQIVVGVRDADDPAVTVVYRLMAEYPQPGSAPRRQRSGGGRESQGEQSRQPLRGRQVRHPRGGRQRYPRRARLSPNRGGAARGPPGRAGVVPVPGNRRPGSVGDPRRHVHQRVVLPVGARRRAPRGRALRVRRHHGVPPRDPGEGRGFRRARPVPGRRLPARPARRPGRRPGGHRALRRRHLGDRDHPPRAVPARAAVGAHVPDASARSAISSRS